MAQLGARLLKLGPLAILDKLAFHWEARSGQLAFPLEDASAKTHNQSVAAPAPEGTAG